MFHIVSPSCFLCLAEMFLMCVLSAVCTVRPQLHELQFIPYWCYTAASAVRWEMCDVTSPPECEWDAQDCALNGVGGCADGCLPEFLADGECDKGCNVLQCGWDAGDCSQYPQECFKQSDGGDYRGHANMTRSGHPCQMWSQQSPHQHPFSSSSFAIEGLGAHAFCRNPDGEASPWCYTTASAVRWEMCDVTSPPASQCQSGDRNSARVEAGPDCKHVCGETLER